MKEFKILAEYPAGYKANRGAKAPRPKGQPVNLKRPAGYKSKRKIDLTKSITKDEVRSIACRCYENLIISYGFQRRKYYEMNWRSFKNSFNIYFYQTNYKNDRQNQIDKTEVSRRLETVLTGFYNQELGKNLRYLIEVKENYHEGNGFYVRVKFI